MNEEFFKFIAEDEIDNLADFFEEQQDIMMDDLNVDLSDYDFGEFTV